MEKQAIIAFLEGRVAEGDITKEELIGILRGEATAVSDSPAIIPVASHSEHSKGLIHTLYGIGAIIALAGISILIADNWETLGVIGRLTVTLGISFATYIFGLVLRGPEQRTFSQVMFLISVALAPLGAYVLLDSMEVRFDYATQILVAAALTAIYGTAFFARHLNILFFAVIAFMTWLYLATVAQILDGNLYTNEFLIKLSIMLLGASYILTGHAHRTLFTDADVQDGKEKRSIRNLLYGAGTFALLGTGITIDGFFNLLFIFFIFGAFYGSVYLKSRMMLILGALFLMAHIIKITSEYFVDSIGWPLALIFIGFFVISIGYLTFHVNRKYIS